MFYIYFPYRYLVRRPQVAALCDQHRLHQLIGGQYFLSDGRAIGRSLSRVCAARLRHIRRPFGVHRVFAMHVRYITLFLVDLPSLPNSPRLIFNRSLSTKQCSFVFARLLSLPRAVSITACVVSTSLSYAIGRDGALPRQLARINSMSQLPTNAIGAVFVATSLLSLVHPSTLDHVTSMFQHDA